MTFSYTGNPGVVVIDTLRFLVGDVDETEQQLQNEEYIFLQVTWSDKNSPYYIASMAANAIAAKLTREVNFSSDSDSIPLDGLQQKYLALAKSLMAQHKELLSGGNVDVGGITIGELPSFGVVPPSFAKGMHDDPSSMPDYGDWRQEEVANLTTRDYYGNWWNQQ